MREGEKENLHGSIQAYPNMLLALACTLASLTVALLSLVNPSLCYKALPLENLDSIAYTLEVD